MTAHHRIDELLFDIAFESPAMGIAQVDNMRALIVDKLLPAMEQVFDQYAVDGAVWRLDTLSVDVGPVTEAEFPAALAASLRGALEQVLQLHGRPPNPEDSSAGVRDNEATSGVRMTPLPMAESELLLAYLGDGMLPWQLDVTTPTAHEDLLQRVLTHGAEAFIAALRASSQRGTLLSRLIRQFPRQQLAALLRLLGPTHAEPVLAHLERLQALLRQAAFDQQETVEAMHAAWENVFSHGLSDPARMPALPDLLAPALARLGGPGRRHGERILSQLAAIASASGGDADDGMESGGDAGRAPASPHPESTPAASAVSGVSNMQEAQDAQEAQAPQDRPRTQARTHRDAWQALREGRGDMSSLAELIRHSPSQRLHGQLQQINPAHAAHIIDTLSLLQEVVQQAVPNDAAATGAMQAVWLHVFTASLQRPGQLPASADMLSVLFSRLAATRQQDQRDVVLLLAQAALRVEARGRPGDMLRMLAELKDAPADRGNTAADVAAVGKRATGEGVPFIHDAQALASTVTTKNRMSSAFMHGDAGEMYGEWNELVDAQPEMLRSAILHYGNYEEIREKIASAFPLSLLQDMQALLSPQAAELTAQVWSDAQMQAWLDEGRPDGATAWSRWRRNWWRGGMAYLLQAMRGITPGAMPPPGFDADAYLAAALEGSGAAGRRWSAREKELRGAGVADGVAAAARTDDVASGAEDPAIRSLPMRNLMPPPASIPVISLSLTQLFEAVRRGEQPLEQPGFDAARLEQLVGMAVQEASFLQAIIAHAAAARDRRAYYLQVLHALAHNRIVDLEACADAEPMASPATIDAAIAVEPADVQEKPEPEPPDAMSSQGPQEALSELQKMQLVGRLAKAFMKGEPESLYGDWDVLVRKHAGLLREALRHYGMRDDAQERIAAAFPESMLHDIVALLAPGAVSAWRFLRDGAASARIAVDVSEPTVGTSGHSKAQENMGVHLIPPENFPAWRRQVWRAALRHLLQRRSAADDAGGGPSTEADTEADVDGAEQVLPAHALIAMLARDPLLNLTAWHQGFMARWMQAETDPAHVQAAQAEVVSAHAPLSVSGETEANAGALRDILLYRRSLASMPESSDERVMALPHAARAYLRQGFARWQELHEPPPATLTLAELRGLIAAFLSADGEAPLAQRQDFLQAIVARAPAQHAAPDSPARYYRTVLHALMHAQDLDLEAIAESSVAESAVSAASPMPAALPVPVGMQEPSGTTVAAMAFAASGADRDRVFADLLADPAFALARVALPHGFTDWLQAAVSAAQPLLLPALASLSGRPAAFGRLLDLLPASSWPRLLTLAPQAQAQRMHRLAGDAADAFAEIHGQLAATQLARLEWEFLLSHLFAVGRVFDPPRFVDELLHFLARETRLPLTAALTTRVRAQMGISLAATANAAAVAAAPTHAVDTMARDAEMPVSADIYVLNAGQVLAAPYLPRLWEALGLLHEGRFKDDAAAQRAVHLLQFLVFEQTATPEYQLALNKLLCGVRSQVPMVRGIEITTHEVEIVEQLLSAMIAHWKIIGSTSLRGLRETFLQRPGHLQLKDDAWHLRVQEGTFDMLLDQLPWSFSIIRYAWMERPVHVNWR